MARPIVASKTTLPGSGTLTVAVNSKLSMATVDCQSVKVSAVALTKLLPAHVPINCGDLSCAEPEFGERV